MVRLAAFLAFLAFLAVPASSPGLAAEDHLVTKKSGYSVAQTLDRLSEVLKSRGIAIVARVDHAAAAEKAGQPLKPTQLLIFGNPKLGTPLMQTNRKVGLELPMKVLAWEDDKGQVWIAFSKPENLRAAYAVSGRDEIFRQMTQALDALTNEAVKSN